MRSPTFNPEEYCPACSYRWGIEDETCTNCGFDPVNNGEDAEMYDEAVILWKRMKELREPN